MSVVTAKASRRWVLQAYLAASPSHPRWCDVEFTAIEGWTNYQHWDDGSKLWRDQRLTDDFSKWWFADEAAAREVLGELLALNQRYFLRVIERQTVLTEVVLDGYDIPDGTVVRQTDGSVPIFMGAPVPNMVDAMPERLP